MAKIGAGLTIAEIRSAIAESKSGVTKINRERMTGIGTLRLVSRRGGANWYFRYSPEKSAAVRDLPIGAYDENNKKGGLGLVAARIKAAELSAMALRPECRDLHAYFTEREQAGAEAKRAKVKAAKAAADEADRKATYTLRKLMTVYCDYLVATNKKSASKVLDDVTRHVFSSPVADRPAADLVKSDITPLVRALVEAEKPRTAGMIRSYVRAAYSLALSADSDAKAPSVLLKFGIVGNPAAEIKAIPVEKRDRALSETELRAFLMRLDQDSTLPADVIRLALLTGGQRPQQLLRLTIKDYDPARGEVTIWDGKGRRLKARKHLLPMGPKARELVSRLVARAMALADNTEGRVFTANGSHEMVVSTPSHWVTDMSKTMLKAKEVVAPFEMKDLRRTVSTHLARMKIGSDVRAQLQSNDLGGVQARHYDQHDYVDEKRQTLVRWERYLSDLRTGKSSQKVVSLRRA